MKCPVCKAKLTDSVATHAWNEHTMTLSEWLAEYDRAKSEKRVHKWQSGIMGRKDQAN